MKLGRFGVLSRAAGSRANRRRLVAGLVAGSAAALVGRATRLPAQTEKPADGGATPAAGNHHPVATPAFAGGPLRARRNANALSPGERAAFVDAVLALKVKPSPWADGLSVYDTFVLWHRDAFGCAVMAAHMGPAFLPWHRTFLRLFEQQLQVVDPSVTVPYWDWTVDNTPEASIWADDLMGGNGKPDELNAVMTGPFRKGRWELTVFDHDDARQTPYLVRDFGGGFMAPTLPTAADVEEALAIPVYDAAPWNASVPASLGFRNMMEGWRDCVRETCDPVAGMSQECTGSHDMHNRVHLWVSGEFALAHEGERADDPEASPVPVPGQDPTTDLFGTMAFNSSPNDPVFWLHHAQIDRLWARWEARHGAGYRPEAEGPYGHNLDDPMWPYRQIGLQVSPRMTLSTEAMGYAYEG